MAEIYPQNFMLYKAKNDGSGAASQLSLGSDRTCLFLEMANQKQGKDDNGNAWFDWANKIRFKLSETDIGEFLAVLVGLQNGVGPFDASKNKNKGLFHSNPAGNAILYFWKDENKRFHIYLSVRRGSKSPGTTDEKIVVKHMITKGEACVLSTLLRHAIEIIYRWH